MQRRRQLAAGNALELAARLDLFLSALRFRLGHGDLRVRIVLTVRCCLTPATCQGNPDTAPSRGGREIRSFRGRSRQKVALLPKMTYRTVELHFCNLRILIRAHPAPDGA